MVGADSRLVAQDGGDPSRRSGVSRLSRGTAAIEQGHGDGAAPDDAGGHPARLPQIIEEVSVPAKTVADYF